MEILVELAVFSGRPNPSWKLTAADAEEAIRRLKDLPGSTRSIEAEGLGFSGFLLKITAARPHEMSYQVRVFHGIVEMHTDRVRYYKDIHDLEQWLIRQAVGHGYGNLMNHGR